MKEVEPLLTPEEAAKHLQVSRRTLQRLPITKLRLGHRTVRYRLRDLEAYEANVAKDAA